MWLIHNMMKDYRGLPSLKGNDEQHECQKVPKGAMNGTTHVGKKATG
jgi:hypothetical protein